MIIPFEEEYRKKFYELEIQDRLRTLFPPFSVFARALFECIDEKKAFESAERFAGEAETVIGKTLAASSPEAQNELLFISCGAAPIRKRENRYRYAVIIKLARTKHTSDVIKALWELSDGFNVEGFRGLELNPNDLL